MKGTNRTSKNINRRKAALRNKLILVMVAFSIAISVGMFAGSNFADAHDNNAQMESIEYKCYKSIELKSGDTLWGIAELNLHTLGICSFICFIAISTALSPLNGTLPVKSSYINIPSE